MKRLCCGCEGSEDGTNNAAVQDKQGHYTRNKIRIPRRERRSSVITARTGTHDPPV